jgi:hypothetical protein
MYITEEDNTIPPSFVNKYIVLNSNFATSFLSSRERRIFD